MITADELTTGLCLNCGCAYTRDVEGRVWEPGEPHEPGCLEGGRCRCHLHPHYGCTVTREWMCDDAAHALVVV